MSREHLEFVVGDSPEVEVSTYSGDLNVDVLDSSVVSVDCDTGDRGYDIIHSASRVIIRPRPGGFRRLSAGNVRLTVPPGTDIMLRTTSGDVRSGPGLGRDLALGRVDFSSASGDLRLGALGELRVKTASGDTYADSVIGDAAVTTASGDIRLGHIAGSIEITSASGDAHVGDVQGSVNFRSASGNLDVDRIDGPTFRGKSLSGDLRVGIPPRREIALDLGSLSGDLRNNLTTGTGAIDAHLRIAVKTVSGNLWLQDAR